MKRITLFAMIAASMISSAAAAVDPVNRDGKGLALKGYDAVAYHTDGRPLEGSAQFTHSWMNATWRFASAEHRDAFAAEPTRYAPQFGGYCAWAVSKGYTANVDPQAWKIVDGKLYLNYSKGVREKWEKEQDARIRAGEKNWPGLHK